MAVSRVERSELPIKFLDMLNNSENFKKFILWTFPGVGIENLCYLEFKNEYGRLCNIEEIQNCNAFKKKNTWSFKFVTIGSITFDEVVVSENNEGKKIVAFDSSGYVFAITEK